MVRMAFSTAVRIDATNPQSRGAHVGLEPVAVVVGIGVGASVGKGVGGVDVGTGVAALCDSWSS